MIHIPKTKLWEACADDEDRPALQDPMFYPNVTLTPRGEINETLGRGTVMAADGFQAVVLDVTHDPEDLEGHIPTAALKAALKANGRDTLYIDASHEEYVMVGQANVPQMFSRQWRNDKGELEPRTMLGLKGIADVIAGRHTGAPQFVSVRLDFEILNRVKEALRDYVKGNKRNGAYFELVLRADQETRLRPVLILPAETGIGFAVQMPMSKPR
ncbi:MAG TPA: hypothetical protein VMY98_07295 [Anaerolineae bacterium]|nr:hypothetical protein [Anaerolineae bacterium]